MLQLAPTRPLFLVGFSLGGSVLLKWLGEQGDRAPTLVVAAAAVSAPFDLEVAARCCDRRYGGLIARHFLRTLVPTAIAEGARVPGPTGAVLPHAAVAASPFLVPQFWPRGGHCGFVDGGTPGRPHRWAEAQVLRFFALHAGWRTWDDRRSPSC